MVGFGVLLVREVENDRLHLEGEGWFSYEDCFDKLLRDTTYILQPVEHNHPFSTNSPRTWQRFASVIEAS